MPPSSHTSAARAGQSSASAGQSSAARAAQSSARAGQSSAARAARGDSAQHTRARPRQVAHRLPISKVGWDRKFRLVMVVVFCLVGWIGLKAGAALLAARSQAAQETGLVSSLEAQHRQLVAQERALHQPATIIRAARQLGMVRVGERAYVFINSSH